MSTNIDSVIDFLSGPTPESWCQVAIANLKTLLIDHAHCEKKAASTAIHMMHRYPERKELIYRSSRLAREELRHFEQVIALMQRRNIKFINITPSRYAASLRRHVRTYEPQRLVDLMIIGAFIEARSCERFHALLPYLDEEMAKFYGGLLASEARHFEGYLKLATLYSIEDTESRIAFFREIEGQLIESPDSEFRFHSGVPAEKMCEFIC